MTTFLKWAGGKTQLLPELRELFPDMNNVKGYIEPFIGGGSVFFYIMENFKESLSKKNIYISDANPELINCYKVVKHNLEELLPLLQKHQNLHNEDYYYRIRDTCFSGSDVERASKFIYLNKTCFNGLWRVNRYGKNNVPIGHKNKVDIYDKIDISTCSRLLQYAHLNTMSFEDILKFKNIKGYMVYMDPPYYDMDTKGNFATYTSDGFERKRSLMLNVFKSLDELGCKVMMSNSYSPTINMLFKDFNIKILKASRMINSDGKNRGPVREVVVMNYEENRKQRTIDDAWS